MNLAEVLHALFDPVCGGTLTHMTDGALKDMAYLQECPNDACAKLKSVYVHLTVFVCLIDLPSFLPSVHPLPNPPPAPHRTAPHPPRIPGQVSAFKFENDLSCPFNNR